ncbi:NAD-dependent succinate-semialdehyde dehydrogenase [Cereibacter azotoformans]|uniref:Aspartate-semialdehyde dehydrogenase n=1 Tax=Cereibacter azotoformans TaxID=43057 RepID=A0A2T5KAC4_9RHOB|nr:NAD-dependent succinate-semialdehyde dehydrogenase [Cereibacter azotoformans]AXQ95206.1 NAD-dependent succinate-semialdehyde dehydrogenase [Cereibacter sphaeroides]PTR19375.1 aspartate-semialdehyde dehydrogenase [Cereibacter azotoformans]UIJ32580.1 NAD-dependent succinate-semialdehyde dehydrogenase [Cereibacter azotoformans]
MNARPLQTPHPALSRLTDRALLRTLGHVGGRWTAAPDAADFAVTDPASGALVARVARLGPAETDAAIAAARAAFPGWRDRLPQERARILHRWAELMRTAIEDLALIMTLEQGKPLAESRGEIAYAAEFLDWYAGEAPRLNVEGVTPHLPEVEMIVRREALGPVGVVTPWNFPSAMITRKVAAALAAGCTTVVHPSAETPLSALALAELAERAGLPPGVMNLVPGEAAGIVGQMCTDPRLAALSFTGSTEVGRLIATTAAPGLKRLVMELGGHAPMLVFADADLDRAVDLAMDAKFATSGQDCLAANRIYVERPILPAFTERLARRIARLKVGPGLDPGTEIGPLMHARALAKVAAQVEDALARGARLVTGGHAHPDLPLAYMPTLLVGAPDEALIHREETFGPVASLLAFDGEAEAIARANATDYGLVAYVVTRDGARALRMARALEFGMVAVNRVKITGGPVPFGGWKQSGLGREGSRHGIEAFTELKYLCIDTAA